MWDHQDLEEAVRGHPLQAAEALAAVQRGPGAALTMDSLAAAADLLGRDRAELLVEELGRRGLQSPFAAALESRGALVGAPEHPSFVDHVDGERLELFSPRARGFRCQVLVDGEPAGSGCLLGPSLVLTAWHVIAVGPPGGPQEPAPEIRVALADSTQEAAVVPPCFQSPCGDAEFGGTAPTSDEEVEGRHDVAVLVMLRPAAAHLGYVALPSAVPRTVSKEALVLVHFPAGQDQGWGFGRLTKIRKVTARWQHSISTAPGSSGGACFDRHLELVGVHQGKWGGGGRLVPVSRFLDDLRPLVAADLAPTSLWSLDGTRTGQLVLGRDQLFAAVAATADDGSRVRGLRIKRADVAGGTTGLAFSYELLAHLLQRRASDHVLVRIGFDALVTDLVDDVARRVAATGLPLPLPAPLRSRQGAVSPERDARDRASLLAAAVEEAARRADRTVWCCFETPSVALTESARSVLDAFVGAALHQPHLRLVVAGFETVALPGRDFPTPSAAAGPGPPGLVVEYLRGFTRRHVLDLLGRAYRDLTRGEPNPVALDTIADRVLAPLTSMNGVYRAADLEVVAAAVRDDLLAFEQRGGRVA